MKRILVAMLSLGVLALAGPAAAQTADTVSGVVVSSSTDSLVIRLDDGSQRTFVTDTTSTLPSGRLAEGNRVTVRFGSMDGGRSRASSVALALGAPAERPADRPITQEPAMREGSTTDPSTRTLPDTASGMPLQGRPADRPITEEPAMREGSATDRRTRPDTASGMPVQGRPADRPITEEPAMREGSTTYDRSARALPDTASGMPLQLLAGLAALAGALLLRRRAA